MSKRDIIPIRLPSGCKAFVDLPRPFTVSDATHLCAFIVQYIEGENEQEAKNMANKIDSNTSIE